MPVYICMYKMGSTKETPYKIGSTKETPCLDMSVLVLIDGLQVLHTNTVLFHGLSCLPAKYGRTLNRTIKAGIRNSFTPSINFLLSRAVYPKNTVHPNHIIIMRIYLNS